MEGEGKGKREEKGRIEIERRGKGVRGKVEAWVMRVDYYRQMRKREEKGNGLRRRTMRKEVE